MPIYLVTDVETKTERLVDAARAATALKHVTTPRFTVVQAEPLDMYRLGKDGVAIECAAVADDATDTAPECEE